MRHIIKNSEPILFTNWKRQNRIAPQNLTYDSLGQAEKSAIKSSLLVEQGYLCAYTMKRITAEDCHIEHIKPQSLYPEQDIDYENMIACFPKDGGDVAQGYGAPIKAGHTVDGFVSPLRQDCEARFAFTENGQIQAKDDAAGNTIDLLNLDHQTLVEYRQAAIAVRGIALQRSGRKPQQLLTASQARRLAIQIMQPNEKGQIAPFCTAIAQVALRYAQQEEARSQRMKANRHR